MDRVRRVDIGQVSVIVPGEKAGLGWREGRVSCRGVGHDDEVGCRDLRMNGQRGSVDVIKYLLSTVGTGVDIEGERTQRGRRDEDLFSPFVYLFY